MRTSLVALAVVLLISPIQVLAQEPVWKEYVSLSGRFQVRMPGTVKEKTTGEGAGAAKLNVHMAITGLPGGKSGLLIMYLDLPDQFPKASVDEILTYFVKRIPPPVTGKIEFQKKIMLGNHYGREVWYTDSAQGRQQLAKCRIYLVGKRIYDVRAIGKETYVPEEIVQKFFGSFKLAEEFAWQETTSAIGQFKVQLPGPPIVINKMVPSPSGNTKVFLYITELKASNVSFGVGYSDSSKELVQTKGLEKTLEDSVQGVTTVRGTKVEKSTKIMLGNYPGREVQLTVSRDGQVYYGNYRFYLVENRLYHVDGMGVGRPASAELLQKVQSSFALLPEQK
jgi:hypothetical protein